MKIETTILAKTALFEGISETSIELLLESLGVTTREYEKNSFIFLEGDSAKQFGIMLDGSASIIKTDYNGNRSIHGIVGNLEIFAESYACSGDEFYPVSVFAETRCKVVLINIRSLQNSCINSCEIHRLLFRNLMKIIAKKNLMLSRKIDFMSKRTTKEKLMAYLYSESERVGAKEFTIPFDRQALADYLGVERSAMSSEIGKLRDEGIIRVDKSHFQILK